jgi:hypothetical protein
MLPFERDGDRVGEGQVVGPADPSLRKSVAGSPCPLRSLMQRRRGITPSLFLLEKPRLRRLPTLGHLLCLDST